MSQYMHYDRAWDDGYAYVYKKKKIYVHLYLGIPCFMIWI